MSDLRDLYQETILDHGKNPRNFRKLEDADRCADGHNPLCGDRLTVWVKLDGDRITDVTFDGNGCAISMASASMMGETLRGRSIDEVRRVFESFHELVTGGAGDGESRATLGKLVVFSGVSEFPVRVKCATLAWHTLRAALERGVADDVRPVSTERAE
ncbi:MAG TPA: SUF system NifU family Fe-S cluster assembly protein [Candidatus Polarisedimenticolaceae bacterium]|nr:SUF system NifU family Fe-S cluster assembly protein [Candidatus Polarisedimenticolaceae bacterium]